MSAGSVKSSLRIVLRHFKGLPSAAPANSPYKAYLREQFRARVGETDKALAKSYRRGLGDYARTLEAVVEQKRLRALDSGDTLTEAEKNAVIARKIGLTLPDAYDPANPKDLGQPLGLGGK